MDSDTGGYKMEILTVEKLNFRYSLGKEKALSDLSFSLSRGDFAVVCGATGSGKSTLLRLLKRELIPNGELEGEVRFSGEPLSRIDEKSCAAKIGYVMQNPEQQIVTDKVWHELAFGLENMGLPSETIRRRVAETACYFGIEDWFEKSVSELSGGQKQLLSLASVMVMQPELLLLDEPTAQLDPIAAADFISTVSKLNRELSLTVLMTEHRLEEVLPVADKLLALERGRPIAFGKTRETTASLKENQALSEGMPASVRLFSRFNIPDVCPLTVREGREFIEKHFGNHLRALPDKEYARPENVALEFCDVFFRYAKALPDVLRGLTFKVYDREIFCILGGNGSGKSTTLAAASALVKPYSGKIKVFGKKLHDYRDGALYRGCLSMLPQDVQTVFSRNTVKEELLETGFEEETFPFGLSELSDRHPYDLSGGQQQLLALAKVLASKPRLLLLDEPTKGLDAHTRNKLISVIKDLKRSGVTIVAVTHDVEFAAEIADRCALFFRGEIVSSDVPRHFFSGNSFYTTAASRMTVGYYDLVSTVSEAEELCKKNLKSDES